jgi:anti-anti-sigma regulatory factor
MQTCWEFNNCDKLEVCDFYKTAKENNTQDFCRCWEEDSSFCKMTECVGRCVDCEYFLEVRKVEGKSFKILTNKNNSKEIIIEVNTAVTSYNIYKFEDRVIKEILKNKTDLITFDFKKTERIDSSFLGCLLVIKNFLDDSRNIKLINLSDHCKKLFERVQFDKLFSI